MILGTPFYKNFFWLGDIKQLCAICYFFSQLHFLLIMMLQNQLPIKPPHKIIPISISISAHQPMNLLPTQPSLNRRSFPLDFLPAPPHSTYPLPCTFPFPHRRTSSINALTLHRSFMFDFPHCPCNRHTVPAYPVPPALFIRVLRMRGELHACRSCC